MAGGVRCAGRALEGRYCEDLGLGRGTTKEKKKLFYLIGLKLYKLLDIYSLFTTAMTLFIILYVHAKLQRTAGLKKNSFIYISSLLSGRGNAARLCPVLIRPLLRPHNAAISYIAHSLLRKLLCFWDLGVLGYSVCTTSIRRSRFMVFADRSRQQAVLGGILEGSAAVRAEWWFGPGRRF